MKIKQLITSNQLLLSVVSKRYFVKNVRPFNERMRVPLGQHKNKRLSLAKRIDERPEQYQVPKLPPTPTVVKSNTGKLGPLTLPYNKYTDEQRKSIDEFETYYDPLFNPHLLEERHTVNPNEEPFNAIYSDTSTPAQEEYTKVRNITSQELWNYVERLARIKVAPKPKFRKPGEPIKAMPSGFVPPPEQPPDLPYFVARTRNYLLPVYYRLLSDPNECATVVKFISGDLWKLEEDLRKHLESLNENKQRILTSVQEPDERIEFRGRHIHQVVDWLYNQGF